MLIAAGVLFGASTYYNIDTNEIIVENIQRVTNTIRATAGLIVGGGATDSPTAGYGFEVATSTLFSSGHVSLSEASQELKFTGGTNYYIGFKSPTNITTTTVYTWPGDDGSSDYLLKTAGDGTLSWTDPGDMGLGTITGVGDVSSGAAFTSDGIQGTSLWFYDANGRGQLTIADLTATTTYTLPNLTGTISLQDTSTLASAGILLADASGLITQDSDFTYASNQLQVGSGGIKLLGSTSGYIELKAAATSDSTAYTWPGSDGAAANYVLTTDGAGGLAWQALTGEGISGVSGTGTANKLAKWSATSSITDSSITDTGSAVTIANPLTLSGTDSDLTVEGTGTSTFAGNVSITGTLDPTYVAGYTLTGNIMGSGGPNITEIGQFSGITAVLSTSVTSPLYTGPSNTDVTISSAGTGDIILDPATGEIRLATTTTQILTSGGGPASRLAGEQILREMIPIFGFDLPAQTATTSYVQISKTLEDYPFSSALSGTTRIHKLVFRYSASTTNAIDVHVATTSGAYSAFTLSVPASTDLDKGEATTTAVTIPTDSTAWWIEAKTATTNDAVRFYQIFLAAYDEVN